MKKIYKLLFPLTMYLLIGCAFFSMDIRDTAKYSAPSLDIAKKPPENNSSVIMGEIKSNNEYKQPVVVIAYSLNFPGKKFNDYVVLDEPGEFMLYLPEGAYHLYTIIDNNNNSIFESNEVNGVYGKPDSILLNRGDVITGINIEADSFKSGEVQFPKKIKIVYDYNCVTYLSKNGQTAKIYNEIFSRKNAEAGWWSPSLFMKAFGANIYSIDKYDPRKIPVLFVHGAKGSPQDWIYFLIRMDKKYYQPFFFYYPSGLRLPLVSKLLYEKIKHLRSKYHFDRICLAAHSAGGLITRSMLTHYDFNKKNDFIKLYVTFATPWSGFTYADTALRTSPLILPSWIDVASRSMFIKRTLRKKIPQSIDYYLFYGKYDKTSKGRALDERAYSGAKGRFGFDTDHDQILTNRDVFLKFNEILTEKLH